MGEYDSFRANAAEAQEAADRAINLNDKTAWLLVAQGWLSLLAKRTASENFDDDASARETREYVSNESQ
jgi:hypothetical protein